MCVLLVRSSSHLVASMLDPRCIHADLTLTLPFRSRSHVASLDRALCHRPFPRRVHQTWQTHTLPTHLLDWSSSWRSLGPEWEYRLWNDTENRQLIEEHYSWFLPYYDEYNHPIKRVDATRVFYMYHYGGVYADLDFIRLKSFDALLEAHRDADVILGLMGHDLNFHDSVPNALMISKPRARFWLQAMRELVRRVNCHDPMWDTGPTMLTDLARAHASTSGVRLLPTSYFYPINWDTKAWRQVTRCDRISIRTFADLVELNRTTKVLDADADATAYAITLWSHSWEGGCGHMYQYNTTVAKEVTGGAVQARDRFGNVERASANG
jgi:hypothetical protein